MEFPCLLKRPGILNPKFPGLEILRNSLRLHRPKSFKFKIPTVTGGMATLLSM